MEKVQFFQSPLSSQESVLLSSIIINYAFMALEKFFPKYLTYIITLLKCHDPSSWQHLHREKINDYTTEKTETRYRQNIGINREEVGFIMSDLGISLSQEEDQIKDCTSHEEFSRLFDEIEPGLHEIKEAFSIFDQNRDGYIDAKELQMILINLGLREGYDLNACQSMIDQHDRNRDGKIDPSDFFKLVESALL